MTKNSRDKSAMAKRFYITTAIDYPNGSPHMGHAYEKVITDAYARWYRFLGEDVFFLTGTDENGQKLVKVAAENNQDTKKFIDSQVVHFEKLCKDLNISYDDFIRTTEPRHHEISKQFWRTLEKKGDIYFDRYSGYYCIACEAFYTNTQAPELRCPDHGTKLEFVQEDGFFFKMSRYQDWIVDHLRKSADFIVPVSAKKEVLNRLEGEPLKDLSISRPNQGWGIPTPSRSDHVMYTWFDALINYYTAAAPESRRPQYWPASVHVIGKDIIWFHSVIWPIMLHAAGIAVPSQIYVHGMVLAEDGRKMSKSLGNGVDPYDILGKYPVDSFRYYLLRSISSGMDGKFSTTELLTKHNNELANDYGNLVMRVVKLAAKKLGNTITPDGVQHELKTDDLLVKMQSAMNKREHNRALDTLWEAINQNNAYLNESAPWKIKPEDPKLKTVLYNALHGIHSYATLISAFLPNTGEKTLESLGSSKTGPESLAFGSLTFNLSEPQPLFPKIELQEKTQ
ncbi:MAG: methionine--tRNA ligase [Bdellovibrionota bacterium]